MDKLYIENLFRRVREENDPQAFKSLYTYFFKPLFRFSFSLTKSKENAEEIVNDVFIHCWERRNVMENIKNLEVYLFIAVKNRSVDFFRKGSSFETISIDDVGEIHLKFTSDPEQLFITSELLKKMEMAVLMLPPQCRLVFMLIRQYGLKYKEAAEILDLSVKTVENQLAIAIKKITRAIDFSIVV